LYAVKVLTLLMECGTILRFMFAEKWRLHWFM